MDTVVYPQEIVGRELERFVPAKVKMQEDPDTFDEWNAKWTPTFVWLTPEGETVHRTTGFLPEKDFRAHCQYALAHARILEEDWHDARGRFEDIAERFEGTAAAPAARYWAGVAAYKEAGSPEPLVAAWNQLREAHPDSEWTRKASFVWADD